jgi:hypothetical protein
MAYCGSGVKRSCGFNRRGQRVRVCEKHRRLKTTALGAKLKVGKPLRDYTDQRKYHAKYKTLAWIKRKAAEGSKPAKAMLARIEARKNGQVKRSAKKVTVKAVTVKAKATKKAPKTMKFKAKVAKVTPPAPTPKPGSDPKALKAARDKRYRENLKKKKEAANVGRSEEAETVTTKPEPESATA